MWRVLECSCDLTSNLWDVLRLVVELGRVQLNMSHCIQFTGFDESVLSPVLPMGVTREVTASDGTQIRWVEFGSGKPLVISPALGTPLASWLPAIKMLSRSFRLLFVMTRGGYEGPMPQEPAALTVERRADDLAELINSLELREFYMAAHSSGVSPAVVSLKQLNTPPAGVCLISARYVEGPPIGVEALLQRARDDAGFMKVVQSIVVGFSPPSLAAVIREHLVDFGRLEALLRAFEQSRAFSYIEPICPGIAITFVIAEHDPDDVRKTTRQIVDTHSEEPWTLVDVPMAGHFFVQDDGDSAAALITRCLCPQ